MTTKANLTIFGHFFATACMKGSGGGARGRVHLVVHRRGVYQV